jgi:ferritin-like metal-binding protein YciE
MKLQSLEDLFIYELRDIYDAERQIVKGLKRMAKASASDELRTAFEEHLTQTEEQISRLEAVFNEFGIKPKGRACEAMKGLIGEGKDVMEDADDDATSDAGLIAAAQKIEHYEIASYGCLMAWARELGQENAVRLLKLNLDEEKAADEKLTAIAEGRLNEETDDGDGMAQERRMREETTPAEEPRHSEEPEHAREPVGASPSVMLP